MTSYSYYPGLSQQAKDKIEYLVDLGLITANNQPQRREAAIVQQYIREYLERKNSKH